tara:strand:- start:225 stop:404 length:180 start_codon:yes stop_codon:yes gene_type:complete
MVDHGRRDKHMSKITLAELNEKLETTIEIIMEHFTEMEERMEEMSEEIEELRDGTQTSS